MRTRMIIGGVVVAATAGLTLPALASPTKPAQPAAPTCVVVNGPNGATLQLGYAPDGPAGCRTLP